KPEERGRPVLGTRIRTHAGKGPGKLNKLGERTTMNASLRTYVLGVSLTSLAVSWVACSSNDNTTDAGTGGGSSSGSGSGTGSGSGSIADGGPVDGSGMSCPAIAPKTTFAVKMVVNSAWPGTTAVQA